VLFSDNVGLSRLGCLPGEVLEAVSKPQIAVEGKARADEKGEHTR
jgi:hypothetical protein